MKISRVSENNISLFLLIIYIFTSYFAQDVLLPASVNSGALYLFLIWSIIVLVRKGIIIKTNILKWELCVLVVSVVTMLYSGHFAILDGTYYSLIVNAVLVFFISQMDLTLNDIKRVFWTFTLSASGLIVALFLTNNIGDSLGRLGSDLLGNANQLAMILMVSAIYGMWLFIYSEKLYLKMIALVAIVIIYLGMFLSGGRKYVIVPVIFLYILYLYKCDRNGKRHVIKYTLIIAIIALCIYFAIMKIPYFYETIGYRFEGAFGLVDSNYTVDSSTEKREEMIVAAFEQWLKSPLWGYGFDSFKYYNASSVTGHTYYSHNNFAELLYNEGVIGFITYYSFYYYLLKMGMKKSVNRFIKDLL